MDASAAPGADVLSSKGPALHSGMSRDNRQGMATPLSRKWLSAAQETIFVASFNAWSPDPIPLRGDIRSPSQHFARDRPRLAGAGQT